MIVKNEEANLPRCLASVQSLVDEIIVVDTGSEDLTAQIAQEFGATLVSFAWCDDFAAARNVGLAQATSDWILSLDADEELVVHDEQALWRALQAESVHLYLIGIEDQHVEQAALFVGRLFRNQPDIRYQGRYHEQLFWQDQPIPTTHQQTLEAISFKHYGFSPEQAYNKAVHRNIPLLERLRQESGLSLMLLTYLTTLYQNTNQPEKAQECLGEGYERLLPHLLNGEIPQDRTYIPNLLFLIGQQALTDEDYETVRLVCQRGCEWYPTFPPLQYLTGLLLQDFGFTQGAIAYFLSCLDLGQRNAYLPGEPFSAAYMQHLPAHALGCAYLRLGQLEAAAASFQQAIGFEPNYDVAIAGLEHVQAQLR